MESWSCQENKPQDQVKQIPAICLAIIHSSFPKQKDWSVLISPVISPQWQLSIYSQDFKSRLQMGIVKKGEEELISKWNSSAKQLIFSLFLMLLLFPPFSPISQAHWFACSLMVYNILCAIFLDLASHITGKLQKLKELRKAGNILTVYWLYIFR